MSNFFLKKKTKGIYLDSNQIFIILTLMQNEKHIRTICLLTLTVIALACALYVLRPLMIPFILALFFTLALLPIIDIQTKHLKLPRPLAIATTLLLSVAIIGVFSLLVSASISELSTNAEDYQIHVKKLMEKITSSLHLERFGLDTQRFTGPMLENLGKNIGNIVSKTINSIVSIFSNAILILIFVLFLLAGKTARQEKPKNKVWEKGETKIMRYMATKLVISAILGLFVGLTLWLLGVELAIVFGLFAFILNFIPSIGPVIATILPIPVVIMSPDITLLKGILAIAIPGVLQFVFGNFVETKAMGDSLDLHPVTILMSFIFWGMLWGIAGMFLAVPITAVLKMIFEEMELTKPVADLLAGRLS